VHPSRGESRQASSLFTSREDVGSEGTLLLPHLVHDIGETIWVDAVLGRSCQDGGTQAGVRVNPALSRRHKHAILAVQRGHQPGFDTCPMVLEYDECLSINWDASPLNAGGRCHIPASE
jgi:hypothetical protein